LGMIANITLKNPRYRRLSSMPSAVSIFGDRRLDDGRRCNVSPELMNE
jgi:hypothetical protein